MRVVSVTPLYPPAFHAFTASRSAGTQGPVRSLAVMSSSSVCDGGTASFFLRGIAGLSHFTATWSALVVSFPRMSITFTTTLYSPGAGYEYFVSSSILGSWRVRYAYHWLWNVSFLYSQSTPQ